MSNCVSITHSDPQSSIPVEQYADEINALHADLFARAKRSVNSTDLVVAHEAGHLMNAIDQYSGHSPNPGWENTLIGEVHSPNTKDFNLILNVNGFSTHLFE